MADNPKSDQNVPNDDRSREKTDTNKQDLNETGQKGGQSSAQQNDVDLTDEEAAYID